MEKSVWVQVPSFTPKNTFKFLLKGIFSFLMKVEGGAVSESEPLALIFMYAKKYNINGGIKSYEIW